LSSQGSETNPLDVDPVAAGEAMASGPAYEPRVQVGSCGTDSSKKETDHPSLNAQVKTAEGFEKEKKLAGVRSLS
jgi:hypothetical protein